MNDDFLNSINKNIVSLPEAKEKKESRSSNINQNIINNSTPEFSLDTISQKSLSLLGFDLYFDDIIIISMILFLMQEEKKDYILIGILSIMLFDLSIDKIQNFEPIKKLINNLT